MGSRCQIAILSDVHYASASEQARGDDYEYREIPNPLLRFVVRNYRHYLWLRHPLRQNHLLDEFIARAGSPDYVIANGDYCCDTLNVGVSDDATFQSARECLEKLRRRFAPNFRATIGDHEFGKLSLAGQRGGMRLASWRRVTGELGLSPLWRLDIGAYLLLGVASPLLALPAYEADALPEEREPWRELRRDHLAEIRSAFAAVTPGQRIILFCHDPTALPFLAEDDLVRGKLPQVERTIIGHLHSNLVLWKSRLLAGMPPIRFLGHTAKRLSTALSQASRWRPFHVCLCPALSGVQLLRDGGFCALELDPAAREPSRFITHRLK
jgi:hypothetical protein